MRENEEFYQTQADLVEAGEFGSGEITRGAAAALAGQKMLMAATGGANIEEATRLAMGRPRVGRNKGRSPDLHIKISPETNSILDSLVIQTGQTRSEIGREALVAYLHVHGQKKMTNAK